MSFLVDTAEGLRLAKRLSQNGYSISPFLAEINAQLLNTASHLDHSTIINEMHLVEFIEAAIQELNVTRYVEEL